MLLFDQNLSPRLVRLLAGPYPGSMHVREASLQDADDRPIWMFARSKRLCIVSKDDDFRQLATLHGHPPKVIWLHVGNCPTRSIADLLRRRKPRVDDFLADPAAAVLMLSFHDR